MNILSIKSLAIPDVKVVRYAKFGDKRGYFSETFNADTIAEQCDFLKDYVIKQTNETFSFRNTLRGLHIQHNPDMGKLVRLVYGKMIDFALDVRINSPTNYKIVAYELLSTAEYGEWIWLPPGFAHGMWLMDNSMVEYYCTETYHPHSEETISFFSEEIDWSLCDIEIARKFKNANKTGFIMSKKDRC